MLLYGFIGLWLPQIISFASALFVLVMIFKAWRATGSQGLLLLAIVTAIGELEYLAMKLVPPVIVMQRVIFSTWFSALIGAAMAVAWWLHNKHLAAREATDTDD
ncbi:hypothetical protein [Dyella japonica]|uniref:LrgA n=1 Tax=Dyella japonica A8 TaxID=1217721 RepID=A0A075JVP8_9GAMM|nr:hypothetical protein [Dyella japonica]AIF46004.1 hypothetical protein HY57_01340 [Dyella japonica A8]